MAGHFPNIGEEIAMYAESLSPEQLAEKVAGTLLETKLQDTVDSFRDVRRTAGAMLSLDPAMFAHNSDVGKLAEYRQFLQVAAGRVGMQFTLIEGQNG